MSGIWGGLVSLPELYGMREGDNWRHAELEDMIAAQAIPTDVQRNLLERVQSFGHYSSAHIFASFIHVFTHFKLHAHVLHFTMTERPAMIAEARFMWMPIAQVQTLALPAPVKSLLLSHAQSIL